MPRQQLTLWSMGKSKVVNTGIWSLGMASEVVGGTVQRGWSAFQHKCTVLDQLWKTKAWSSI